MICRIYLGSNLYGFRLLDYFDGKTKDVLYKDVYKAVENGVAIENLEIKNNELVGKGGALSRYTAVDVSGMVITKQSVILLRKLKCTDGILYCVCNHLGEVTYLNEEAIIMFGKCGCLANAKVIHKDNGIVVSAIEGSIEQQDARINKLENWSPLYKFNGADRGSKIADDVRDMAEFCVNSKVRVKIVQGTNINVLYVDKLRGVTIKLGNNLELYGHIIYYNKRFYNKTFVVSKLDINGEVKFLVKFVDITLVVNDIIHIGINWIPVYNTSTVGYVTETSCKDSIVLAGNLGIIWIKFSEEKRAFEVHTILYSMFNSVDDILRRSVELGCSDDIRPVLKEKQFKYLMYYSRVSPFKSKLLEMADIERLDISSIEIDAENTGIAHMGEIVDIYLIKRTANYETVPITCCISDELVKNTVTFETITGLVEGELLWSNIFNEYILYSSKDIWRFCGLTRNSKTGEYTYKNSEVPFRYIIYNVLNRVDNRMFKETTKWITDKRFDLVPELVKTHYLDKSTVRLFFFCYVVDIDLNKINELYKSDIERREELSNRFKKMTAKYKLVGQSVTIDEMGYIRDWDSGSLVHLVSDIKGIVLSSLNRGKALTINTMGRSDIDIFTHNYYSWARGIVFKTNKDNIDLIGTIDRKLPYAHYLIEVDCNNMTSLDYNRLFGKMAELSINSGLAVRKGITIKDQNAAFFVKNISKLYGLFKEEVDSVINKITLINVSQNDELVKFLNQIISIITYLSKRYKNDSLTNKSIWIFTIILKKLFSEGDADKIILRLRNHLGEVGG